MLPGKRYSVWQVAQILWLRKWIILLPLIAASAIAYVVAARLPNYYRSDTQILVVPQRVPETYVRSTVTMRIEDRLRTISQQILSRTRLEQMLDEFDLYPSLRETTSMGEVIDKMRGDITIETVRGDLFRLSYTYLDPTTAMKVTDRLAALVIQDSSREREAQAEGTNQFLEAELSEVARRLTEQEKRLEEYRLRHAGELPSQLQSNLQVIQNTQLQIQQLTESMNRDRDRRVVVERMLADLSALEMPVASAPQADAPSVGQLPTERQVELARQSLRELEIRLTAEHPDVVRAREKVRELTDKLAQEVAARPTAVRAPASPAEAVRQNQLMQLRAERDNLDLQVATKVGEEQKLREIIRRYQSRVDSVPARESELTELTRDYDTLQATYRSLLAKKEDSQLSANLEKRQIGEQFRVLDAARLPEYPVGPNRLLIIVSGALGGLMIGLIGVFMLEFMDSTLRSETDVLQVLGLPVLAMVPAVVTGVDGRSKRWRTFVVATAVLCLVAAGVGVVVWKVGF